AYPLPPAPDTAPRPLPPRTAVLSARTDPAVRPPQVALSCCHLAQAHDRIVPCLLARTRIGIDRNEVVLRHTECILPPDAPTVGVLRHVEPRRTSPVTPTCGDRTAYPAAIIMRHGDDERMDAFGEVDARVQGPND